MLDHNRVHLTVSALIRWWHQRTCFEHRYTTASVLRGESAIVERISCVNISTIFNLKS